MTKRNDFFQEIFDKVSNHLLTQNKKSVDINFSDKSKYCRYKFGNLKCAAGCLIPDIDYHESIEGQSVNKVAYFIESGYTLDERSLIRKLQKIHDSFPESSWKSELKKLGKLERLNINF